jgi:succinate dehydrogenase/fumarate reductase flavoprotein subunit
MALSRRELLVRGGTAAALGAGGLASPASAQAQRPPAQWHREADVVVIGAGAAGLPAAIVAREAGSSAIVVEAQPHVGGHARVSGGNMPLGGGNMPLGGGTSVQKRYGIDDSADLVFQDLTDWSVVRPNGFPDYRYNDREIIRTFADNSAATFEFLRQHGVVFVDKPPDRQGGSSVGNSQNKRITIACNTSAELDLKTLVWTRGEAFPA